MFGAVRRSSPFLLLELGSSVSNSRIGDDVTVSNRAVIFITGTSRGIGRHLAEYFSARDFQVVGCSRRAEDAWENPNYVHLQADIGSDTDILKAFEEIKRRFGRLDILVNNAAINPTLALAVMTSFQQASHAMNVNVLGTFLAAREGAKLMMRRKWGRIINMSSMAAKHEVAGEAIYTASKAAINSLTRVLAKEFYPLGITCNAVAPSAIDTELMAEIKPEALQEVLKRNAIPEKGRMEDISHTIEWLIRPESQAITGQIIYLGGV